jgi:hypothetical protein
MEEGREGALLLTVVTKLGRGGVLSKFLNFHLLLGGFNLWVRSAASNVYNMKQVHTLHTEVNIKMNYVVYNQSKFSE